MINKKFIFTYFALLFLLSTASTAADFKRMIDTLNLPTLDLREARSVKSILMEKRQNCVSLDKDLEESYDECLKALNAHIEFLVDCNIYKLTHGWTAKEIADKIEEQRKELLRKYPRLRPKPVLSIEEENLERMIKSTSLPPPNVREARNATHRLGEQRKRCVSLSIDIEKSYNDVLKALNEYISLENERSFQSLKQNTIRQRTQERRPPLNEPKHLNQMSGNLAFVPSSSSEAKTVTSNLGAMGQAPVPQSSTKPAVPPQKDILSHWDEDERNRLMDLTNSSNKILLSGDIQKASMALDEINIALKRYESSDYFIRYYKSSLEKTKHNIDSYLNKYFKLISFYHDDKKLNIKLTKEQKVEEVIKWLQENLPKEVLEGTRSDGSKIYLNFIISVQEFYKKIVFEVGGEHFPLFLHSTMQEVHDQIKSYFDIDESPIKITIKKVYPDFRSHKDYVPTFDEFIALRDRYYKMFDPEIVRDSQKRRRFLLDLRRQHALYQDNIVLKDLHNDDKFIVSDLQAINNSAELYKKSTSPSRPPIAPTLEHYKASLDESQAITESQYQALYEIDQKLHEEGDDVFVYARLVLKGKNRDRAEEALGKLKEFQLNYGVASLFAEYYGAQYTTLKESLLYLKKFGTLERIHSPLTIEVAPNIRKYFRYFNVSSGQRVYLDLMTHSTIADLKRKISDTQNIPLEYVQLFEPDFRPITDDNRKIMEFEYANDSLGVAYGCYRSIIINDGRDDTILTKRFNKSYGSR